MDFCIERIILSHSSHMHLNGLPYRLIQHLLRAVGLQGEDLYGMNQHTHHNDDLNYIMTGRNYYLTI